jgi:RHS repeat-associated protein
VDSNPPNPPTQVTVTGSTCINLNACSFGNNCGPSETAYQISNLLSALAANAQLTSTNVDVKASPYGNLFYNNLIPPASGTLSAVWNGTSNGSGCSLVVNGSSCTFNLAFVNSGFSFANVAYFKNLKLSATNPNTSFTVDAWVSNQFQPVTVTMSTACYNFQKCVPPPNKCTGPEYRNNDILTAGLNTIASQGKLLTNFSLSTMPSFAQIFPFTNVAQAYWKIKSYNTTTKTLLVHLKEWTGVDTTKRDSIYLAFKTVSNPHTFANIVNFSDLQVAQYSFTILAKFSDNTSDTLVGRLPITKLTKCETCKDIVLDFTVTKDGDCECNHLNYPNTSGLTELSNSSCAEGFKISTNNTCATWPVGSSHSGKFMTLHYNGADVMVWKQALNPTYFVPSQPYRFKIWFKRMTGTFDLTLKVNGTVVKSQQVTPSAYPTDNWFEVYGDWTTPSSMADVNIEVYFHRVDTGTDTYFGLDEMTMQRISPCNNTLKDPITIPYVNPCVKNLKDIATTNAIESYNAYIKGIKSQFRDNYISTCKNALENLKMVYTDREHHITLYYYDQAGNLIKTVPPEGVVKVTSAADFTQIAQDRYNKTQTYFTKHTLKTRYEYNALNQLIRQATPDQDLMNKWLLNGASTIPSTTNIYGMAFSDGNKGFVVGDNGSGTGVIYTTTDGGKTWSKVLSIGVGNLQDVQFIGTTAYAISDKGELVKSSNSGTTWTTVVTPTAQKLNDLYFSSATNGVIVGNAGTILKTSNGGTSWDAVTIDPAAIPAGVALSTINLNDLHFTSSTTGYIAGSNAMVLRTTNSGTNWYALPGVTNPMSTTVNLNAIHFLSATSGYVAGVNTITGQGVIATATINVGQTATTWTYPTVSPIASNCEFKTIHGVDANNVFAAGTNGKLYATSASSAGVFNVYSISGITGTPEITELTFTDAANPLVGFGSLKNGQLIKSTAAGGVTSWTATNVSAGSLSNPPANGIYFEATVPPYTGYLAVDGGSVLKTTDGGTTWSTISGYYAPAAALEDIYMVKNSTAGYAVGKTGYIIKTTDGGSTWNGVTSGVSNDLKAVVFEDANTGIVVGMGGKLLKVTSGSTVSTITNSPAMTNDMYDVVQLASPASTYVAVGSSGKIVKGTSSTSTWTTNNITSNAGTQTLYAVYFVGNTGFAVGSAGTIVKTTDGGNTWAALTSGVSAILREVYFKDELIGYAMGDGGVIIKTVDGGANWKVQPGTATGNFYAANFTNDGKAILGGTSVSGSPNMANLTDDSFDYGSRFWYDRLGRMVISQNSKQFNKATPAYSYTKYDEQGRIAEVGEVATTTDVNTLANVHGVVYDDGMFKTWLNAGTRSEVTTTVYDAAASNAPVGFVQENLRKRVSATYVDDDGNLGNGYVHSSIYSYDIHGNVKTLIQDITAMADFSQRYKRIDYNYDLISGSVSKVCYQPGQSDQFYHKYEYDAENRITRAFTSRDGVIWDQDAKYFYYQHGPLARVELGEDKIHANDYVYTIQGWLKGVNSNTMNTSRDPGKDGIPGSLYTGYVPDIHAKIGRDAYGYSLSYYDAPGITGDYSAINTSANLAANDFEARATAAEFVTTTPNLYNGNIKRMVSSFYDIDPSSPTIGQSIPMLSDYKYDQLNRIVEMKAFRSFDLNNNLVNTTYDQAYESAMTYDANGNLLTLKANGKVGNLNMDQLTYKYDFINNDPNQGKRSNRLYHVNDIASTYSTDIDDQGAFTPEATNNIGIVNTNNNYGYDELGNLTRDNQEQIASIGWTVYGKIKNIQRTGGSTKPALDFTYDATGNRLSKKVTTGGVPITTYYVRDAQGNIMATYERANTWYNAISTKEYTVYGSSRLGTATAYNYIGEPADIFSRLRKNKYYELSNHLGNVLSTIYDRKVGVDNTSDGIIDYYTAYVTSTSDYYPYGAPLPGRGYTATSGYRYGFNGKENDSEVKGAGNQQDYGMRIYDPRLGRFLSVDPITKNYPELTPYQFASNTPIQAIDLDGLEAWLIKNKWSPEYVAKFRTELNTKISQYQAAQKEFTCDDLALECIISFAASNNLPFKWTTEAKTFDAASTEYKDYNTFLLDVKKTSGAPDFANSNNTTKSSFDNVKAGSLVVLTAEDKKVPNHIQLVTGVLKDDGVNKGYNAAQGNFNSLGRVVGSDDPESMRYLGVPVQKGYYSQELDTWNNQTENKKTPGFFQDHYEGEYREYNFQQWNCTMDGCPSGTETPTKTGGN